MRNDQRLPNQLRPIKITRSFTKAAEGSVLVVFGDTKVICTATLLNNVPSFLKDSGQGWITAEYGMLPRSTPERMAREAARGKQGGRTQEIQRLIGRSLRAAVDMEKMGENTIVIDCDVIQADGGTRTASITGGMVALYDALTVLATRNHMPHPCKQFIAAVSVGISKREPLLDLNYEEDTQADVDMNVIMTEKGEFIEIQGTGEKSTFTFTELTELVKLADGGIKELIRMQKLALGLISA